ncbi:type II secretion system protein GspE [Candidatus Peregrinibacteria bacterium CG11_big_fil_rev_8_21_14_0_20_46_8]|nr:MAG: type II secretion system protein GspE [Candidatus Peregrinibacteria bacterium CG11_big_fil_rev_8_21_14_0_20_46_8]
MVDVPAQSGVQTGSPPQSGGTQSLQEAILAGNVPQIVLNTISSALEMRSSDIHIEPQRNATRIRYRVDGALHRIVEYPNNMHPAVVSRIKIMSNLKIDEQRIPQDGRASVTSKDNREMDLRVSTLPTVNGEKIVMRIQDKSRKIPSLEQLGLAGSALRTIEKSLGMPNGITLTTGPTGSGKTTTLYACLSILNTEDVNIMTVEDPVEIQLPGLNQSQMHPEIEYNFASGLRTALRQDPDIIMVGEIRDRETIDVAIEASLTGHLVFSTIHTNSAVETLTRISNMGVPGYLMASTINLIIAQRLVRKICEQCRVEEPADEALLKRVKHALETVNAEERKHYDPALFTELKFYIGKGCEACNKTGYFGRVGLYEMMLMNNKLRQHLIDGDSTLQIEKTAIEGGMVTLEQAGILKALQGVTSLDEVYSVAREAEGEEDGNTGKQEAGKEAGMQEAAAKAGQAGQEMLPPQAVQSQLPPAPPPQTNPQQ